MLSHFLSLSGLGAAMNSACHVNLLFERPIKVHNLFYACCTWTTFVLLCAASGEFYSNEGLISMVQVLQLNVSHFGFREIEKNS